MSNGLNLNDIDFQDDDTQAIETFLNSIQLNTLTREQVKEDFDDFVEEKSADDKRLVKTRMKQLAAFIYVNGIHDSLSRDLRVDDEVNYGVLKDFFDIKAGRKQMVLRYVVSLIHIIHQRNNNDERNLISRQIRKFSIDASEVRNEFKYFGSYFYPGIDEGSRQNMLSLQHAVISLSKGGFTAMSGNRR